MFLIHVNSNYQPSFGIPSRMCTCTLNISQRKRIGRLWLFKHVHLFVLNRTVSTVCSGWSSYSVSVTLYIVYKESMETTKAVTCTGTFCHVMDQHDKVCFCVLMASGKWWKRWKLTSRFLQRWMTLDIQDCTFSDDWLLLCG